MPPPPASSIEKAKRLKKIHQKDAEAVASAKKYLPDCGGCSLNMQTEWHCRWRVTYENAVYPPYTCSATFAEGNLEERRKALFKCLKFAWDKHEEAGLGASPYDFTA